MAKLRLKELMASHNLSPAEMAAILWPEANIRTRRTLMSRWLLRGVLTVRMDQLQSLYNRFGEKLIEYDTPVQ